MMERARSRTELRTRWDPALKEACVEFSAAVRRILELSETSHAQREHAIAAVTETHGRLQRYMTEIRLLGGPEVQLAARHVVRHAWAVQMTLIDGVDPRARDYPAVSPRERTLVSLFRFYLAARRQLRMPEADSLVALNPALDAHRPGMIVYPAHPTNEEVTISS
jgi:hypothetical protein